MTKIACWKKSRALPISPVQIIVVMFISLPWQSVPNITVSLRRNWVYCGYVPKQCHPIHFMCNLLRFPIWRWHLSILYETIAIRFHLCLDICKNQFLFLLIMLLERWTSYVPTVYSFYRCYSSFSSYRSGYGLSQWETTLQCNVVSYCLSPWPEWPLFSTAYLHEQFI